MNGNVKHGPSPEEVMPAINPTPDGQSEDESSASDSHRKQTVRSTEGAVEIKYAMKDPQVDQEVLGDGTTYTTKGDIDLNTDGK